MTVTIECGNDERGRLCQFERLQIYFNANSCGRIYATVTSGKRRLVTGTKYLIVVRYCRQSFGEVLPKIKTYARAFWSVNLAFYEHSVLV